MSHVKAAGTAKNLNDSNPKYLGVKIYAGGKAKNGSIIVRQRGTKMLPGKNTLLGKDHTIFANKEGIVSFSTKRKTGFNGKTVVKKVVNVN
jgi:large subunit ribosomal protein L27